MGFSSAQLKMKFLIVCLFAAAYAAPEAEAEADPAVFYGGYGYPYAYGGYGLTYGLPAVHTVVKAAEPEADAYYGHYGYAGYGYATHPYSYGYRAYRPYGYGYRYGAYWG